MSDDIVQKMKSYKQMLDDGLIGVAMQGSGQQENNFFIFPWY